MTIGKAINNYIAYRTTASNREQTVRSYSSTLRLFEQFATGQGVLELAAVTAAHFDTFQNRRAAVVAVETTHREATLLKAFFGWCEDEQFIHLNPLGDRDFSPLSSSPPMVPTLGQINDLLDAASPDRRSQFALLAFAGVRACELANLAVDDGDSEFGWVCIWPSPAAKAKSGHGRKLPMHPRLGAMLQSVPRKGRGSFFDAQSNTRPESSDGRVGTRRLRHDYLKTVEEAGLLSDRGDCYSIHLLRQFFHAACISAGVPDYVVHQWLGLGGITGATRYVTVSDEDSQRYMRMLPFDAKSNEW